ncbi:MAG: hypothetical protein Q4C95_12505, partial [Planctomycetia bacterium]|nr:hypothetical protein [Planctomycetia bacterium]
MTEVTMKGLKITGGYADLGGGIYNANSGITNLEDCWVINNEAKESGGGIYHHKGTLNLQNGVVAKNTAVEGGGVYNNTGTLNIKGLSVNGEEKTIEFTKNTAENGGGVFNYRGTVTLTGNSSVSGNKAENGGGIYNDQGMVTLTGNSSFSGNTAVDGGAFYNKGTATATFTASNFQKNSAGNNGGAIYNEAKLDMVNTTVSENTAVNGGAFYNTGSEATATFTASNFQKNSAGNNGGAIYNEAKLDMVNTTVSENTAVNGGAFYNTGSEATATFTASNFQKNSAGNNGGAIYNEAKLDMVN